MENKEELKKQTLALSLGKDSTTIALLSKEKGIIYDEFVFADTGAEFPELYEYLKVIEKDLNKPITILKPKLTIEEFMQKIVSRGKFKGKPRGFPQRLSPCGFMRDTKVVPLEKISKGKIISIGYASDETSRVQKSKNYRYPLIEWNFSENMCAKYLNLKSKLNPLYTNFNRLGCYFCPHQNTSSLYVVWKLYPKFWEHMKKINKLNKDLGCGEIPYGDKWEGIERLETQFKAGLIPKKRPIYDCFQCKGVSKAFKKELTIKDFCKIN